MAEVSNKNKQRRELGLNSLSQTLDHIQSIIKKQQNSLSKILGKKFEPLNILQKPGPEEKKYHSWESWQTVDGKLIWISPRVEGVTGYTSKECAEFEKYPQKIIFEEDRDLYEKDIARLLENDVSLDNRRLRIRRKDDEIIWVSVSFELARDSGGNILGIKTSFHDVDYQITIEKQLKDSQKKYENLINNVPFGIIELDKKGKIDFANDSFLKLLKYGRNELYGMNFFDLNAEEDGAKKSSHVLDDMLSGQVLPIPFQMVLQTKDGLKLNVQVNWNYLRDNDNRITGLSMIVSDITQRKLFEEKLRDSEEKFRTLFNSLQQKIFFKNTDSVYISCNQSFADMFDLRSEQVAGKTDFDLFPKKMAKGYREDDKKVIESGEGQSRIDKILDKGNECQINIVKTPIKDDQGNVTGVLGIFWDITDQMKAEEKIKKLNHRLEDRVIQRTKKLVEARNHLLREIEERKNLEQDILEVSEREKRLIGQELHDSVGQQFIAASFMLKNLERKIQQISPEHAEEVSRIKNYISTIMNQTRAIARGLNPVNVTELGLLDALHRMAFNVKDLFGVDCKFDCKIDYICDADNYIHVYRIVQEAITNSLKHGAATKINIKVEEESSCKLVNVISDGKDFPEKLPNGKGIGLKTMSRRAEMMGGELEVKKNPEGGTWVKLKIPEK